jgi:hypothetical protein
VIFPGYSGFLHDITEILLKVALNTITLTPIKNTGVDLRTRINYQYNPQEAIKYST